MSFIFFSKIIPVPFKQSNRVMAMARRSAIPSIHLARSKYRDFDPKFEWKEENHAYFLILHLPGFLKEQVKITYVHSSQTIRIHGERPIENSIWSRFDKPFLLPPNCLSDKIYGRFQHGFLTVTIPKQPLPAKPQPKPTSLFPEKERQTSEDEDQKRQKEASSSFSPLEDNLREHRPEVSQKIAEKQMESREKVNSDAEQNPEKEVKRKESLSDADKSHQLKTEKEENESPEKQKITDKTTERIPGKTPEITEKGKEKEERNSEESVKDTKQKLKIVSKRLEEDNDGDNKQTLINMGAALLVLLAIGAYTAFNFSSFPKSRN